MASYKALSNSLTMTERLGWVSFEMVSLGMVEEFINRSAPKRECCASIRNRERGWMESDSHLCSLHHQRQGLVARQLLVGTQRLEEEAHLLEEEEPAIRRRLVGHQHLG